MQKSSIYPSRRKYAKLTTLLSLLQHKNKNISDLFVRYKRQIVLIIKLFNHLFYPVKYAHKLVRLR